MSNDHLLTREQVKANNVYRWRLEQAIIKAQFEAQADRAAFRAARNEACANVINNIRTELVGA